MSSARARVVFEQSPASCNGINNTTVSVMKYPPNNIVMPSKIEAGTTFRNVNGGYDRTPISSITNQSNLDSEIEASVSRAEFVSLLAGDLLAMGTRVGSVVAKANFAIILSTEQVGGGSLSTVCQSVNRNFDIYFLISLFPLQFFIDVRWMLRY